MSSTNPFGSDAPKREKAEPVQQPLPDAEVDENGVTSSEMKTAEGDGIEKTGIEVPVDESGEASAEVESPNG